MNIFALSTCPLEAAKLQKNQHVIKMTLETAQILCTSLILNGIDTSKVPYRRTHSNHPCVKWAAQSRANFNWLVAHGFALANEYKLRYGKDHKSGEVIEACAALELDCEFPSEDLTPFAQAMPMEFQRACNTKEFDETMEDKEGVLAYKGYYATAKQHIK